jgi:hypothetical protein
MLELCPAISEYRLADSRDDQTILLRIHKVQLDCMANATSAVDGHHVGHGAGSAGRDLEILHNSVRRSLLLGVGPLRGGATRSKDRLVMAE